MNTTIWEWKCDKIKYIGCHEKANHTFHLTENAAEKWNKSSAIIYNSFMAAGNTLKM